MVFLVIDLDERGVVEREVKRIGHEAEEEIADLLRLDVFEVGSRFQDGLEMEEIEVDIEGRGESGVLASRFR